MMTLVNRAYYALRPLVPWTARMAMRRWRGARRRKAYSDVWPIDEKSGATPPGWPGWPEGKRFALVLTHDVEGSRGLARVEQLIELDARYGFRASFNFVPEGEYRVSDSLRRQVEHAGFEVGVHGLKHDGRTFFSKSRFASEAERIREYVSRWGASGFRSPLMHHNLAWMHQLGTEYDSSTFDTDPFEPQPDGAGTIFPFWVAGRDGRGYVELPYTLVQDFTLFTVLREQNIDIWKQKLDWIASHGGMALLNAHPDYMCFDGARGPDEYPVDCYEEFLRYAREKYEGDYWSAIPREVSRFYTNTLPVDSRNTKKKVCMLAYTCYENDSRVRSYAEALVKRGDRVDVIATAENGFPLGEGELNGVRIFRIQRRERDERSKWTYARRLVRFLFVSSSLLTRLHRRFNYDLIHIHNIPDFLVFAAWYPKLTGAKLILDIHDIVPELFADKFKTESSSSYFKLLRTIERASAAFADHVIVANHLWHGRMISRSVPAGKCSVFMNHVDPGVFYRRIRTRNDDKFILLFPGTFQWHQGLDIAVKALALLKERAPNAELHLYGGGGGAGAESRLAQLADELGLEGRVKFFGCVPVHRIAEVIANADLGIVPKRADSFGNEACSTKIMEFMSQGIPVVVSRTAIDQYYFNDELVRFFPSGDSEAMADAILELIQNPILRNSLVKAGLEYVERNNLNRKKAEYLNLVDRLTTEKFEQPVTQSEHIRA
jgi:glycosyltransferase involved in cell wall biosynthesis/peptidoglycan/xylan/chitin deacetylase (PgdA/CDA1 family)